LDSLGKGIFSKLETSELVWFVLLGARAMRRNHWLNGALLALLGLILTAAGCTGSDVLAPRTQEYLLEVEVINTDTRFDVATFQINQIEVRPTDPDADEALDASGLGLFLEPLQMSYANNPLDQSDNPLSNGQYQINLMRLNPIKFLDILDPPASAPTCEEYVRNWSYTTDVFIADLGGSALINIGNGARNANKLVIDGEAFLRAFQESWTCVSTGPGTWRIVSGSFDAIAFGRRAPEYLEFQ
jgi:hypothetical protein